MNRFTQWFLGSRNKPKRSARLLVETMEDRLVPATITVDAAGLLTYDAGAGATNNLFLGDNVTVSGDSFYKFRDDEIINAPGFVGSGTNTVQVPLNAISSIVINLGDGHDAATVQYTLDPLRINGGVGNDKIQIGGLGGLNVIQAEVIVDGQGHDAGGKDSLIVNDQPGFVFGTVFYSVTKSTVVRNVGSNAPTVVNFQNFEHATLHATAFDDTINVLSTDVTTPLVVNAGSGADTINIGVFSPESPPPSQILFAPVTVNGQDGSDTLNINDQAVVSGRTYAIQADVISSSAMQPVTYATVENIAVFATAGSDTLEVKSTAPNTSMLVDGGGHNDLVRIGNDGSLDFMGGTLTLRGSAGADTLDYSRFARKIVVSLLNGTATGVAGGINGFENVFGGSGPDELTGDNNANILIGGSSDDTLTGLGGRDLLIGGLGLDRLDGGADDDILIGGTTSFDLDLRALQAILEGWKKLDQSYLQRVTNLRAALNSRTVFQDATLDVLLGGAGADWFFGEAVDHTDRTLFEQLN